MSKERTSPSYTIPANQSERSFHFGSIVSSIIIRETMPGSPEEFFGLLRNPAITGGIKNAIAVCDENTAPLARNLGIPWLILPAGEKNKNWTSVETILRFAKTGGLGRDGLFIGIGGGVVCDLTAFAASIYMRGAVLALIPTTLVCMADAALGGKTGFDLEEIKNLAGTFYPAGTILIAAETLKTLPGREWKSGMAELIKTAILDQDRTFTLALLDEFSNPALLQNQPAAILPLVKKTLLIKGRIVEEDPWDTKKTRALLNLGHTFGHALESTLGLGTISHGEAVAWGIARSCELGLALGITPPDRAETIFQILKAWGYDLALPEAAGEFMDKGTAGKFRAALFSDKKKNAGKLRFVVPAAFGAVLVEENERVTQFLESFI
ncbi:MAG: 3-dehydroquinate synthase [Treponema sp.]|nr:3-dehydroquinate synthase [Treponema sp.]